MTKAEMSCMEELRNENAGLKSKIEAITIARDKALDKDVEVIESLEKEIKRLEHANNELDNNVKDMFATVRSLKKESLKKDDEIRSLKQDITELTSKKNYAIDKLNDERRLVESLREANDRLLSLCKNKYDDIEEKNAIYDALNSLDERIGWIEPRLNYVENKIDEAAMHPSIGIDLNVSEVMKDVKERITKLENGTLFTNDMLTGISVRLDKIEKPSAIDISLSEVKKDIKEQQEIIDALNDLDQRISWILTHLNNAETEATKTFKKLEDDYAQVNHCMTNAFVRINKLEDAQEKKASKKSTKKSQKSDLS